ncbi:MAG: histone H1 [Selenomonadaceae bacterium]|nr:histone H1 [Selenomonadaceae bacterium]
MARRRRSYRPRNTEQFGGYRGNINSFVDELRAKGEHVVQAAKLELFKGAYDVLTDAQNNCPVRTGKLKDSLKVVDVADGAAFEISADAKNEDGVPYGQFIEYAPWGTPFLLPALESNSDRIRHNIKKAIQNAARQ